MDHALINLLLCLLVYSQLIFLNKLYLRIFFNLKQLHLALHGWTTEWKSIYWTYLVYGLWSYNLSSTWKSVYIHNVFFLWIDQDRKNIACEKIVNCYRKPDPWIKQSIISWGTFSSSIKEKQRNIVYVCLSVCHWPSFHDQLAFCSLRQSKHSREVM